MQQKRYQTQWAAQFFAAAELTRRGYLTSFTLGNAPDVDLLCVSPSDFRFKVDVKGLATKNFWLVRERELKDDLFYILVYIPPYPAQPEYFILDSNAMMRRINDLKTKTIEAHKNWAKNGSGISWGTSQDYKDKWESLPK